MQLKLNTYSFYQNCAIKSSETFFFVPQPPCVLWRICFAHPLNNTHTHTLFEVILYTILCILLFQHISMIW